MSNQVKPTVAALLFAVASVSAYQSASFAQAPQTPQVVSPEVLPDRRVAFRIYAPQARAIRLAASDIPGVGQTAQLSKSDQEVWELTLGPLEPGAYRYNFNVDGVATIDPRNPADQRVEQQRVEPRVRAGLGRVRYQTVPRGAIAEVTYNSTALGKFRRMHVYTPPGYESGTRPLSGVLSVARRR